MQNELIELQTQLAFQEQTIAELNEVLTSQQRQLDILRVELRLLREKMEEGDDGVDIALQEEPPPHY